MFVRSAMKPTNLMDLCGKVQLNTGSFSRSGGYRDKTTMQPHDLPYQGEANSRSLSLGGEEGSIDLFQEFFRDSGTIVFHKYDGSPVPGPDSNLNTGTGLTLHGIAGIAYQVDQGLFKQAPVRTDHQIFLSTFCDQTNVFFLQFR